MAYYKSIQNIFFLVNQDWHAVFYYMINMISLCVSLFIENEPSIFDLESTGGALPVGGFIYRGCQSRRLYGSYVFGDKNG